MILSCLLPMVRSGSVVTLVTSLNHSEQERNYQTILSLETNRQFSRKQILQLHSFRTWALLTFFVFQLSFSYSFYLLFSAAALVGCNQEKRRKWGKELCTELRSGPSHCNAYGWLRSSIFIAVFSQTSSRLHPRVSSGCDSLLFLSTGSLPRSRNLAFAANIVDFKTVIHPYVCASGPRSVGFQIVNQR